jgi:hypothetical protein
MTANGGEELPGGRRRSRRGWNGVRADKSCSVSCGRFVLQRRARLLLSRAWRARDSFPARQQATRFPVSQATRFPPPDFVF